MITTAFHLDFNPIVWPQTPPSVKATAAKYDIGILAFQNEVMTIPSQTTGAQVPLDWAPLDEQVAAFRALNPRMRLGIHAGNLAFTHPWEPAAEWVSANDVYLLWTASGQPMLTDVDGLRRRMMNILNDPIRCWLADHYRAFTREHDLDLLLLDTASPAYVADLIARPSGGGGWFGQGAAPGSPGDPMTMADAMSAYGERLRWSLEEDGRQVMLNGVGPGITIADTATPLGRWYGVGQSNISDYGSAVMFEHFHRAFSNAPDDLLTVLDIVQRIVAKRRHVFCSTQPRLAGPGTPLYVLSTVPKIQQYFHAAYLLVHHPPFTSYGFHPWSPYVPVDDAVDPAVYWHPDWEFELGQPLGEYRVDPTGLVVRDYEHALVLVNPTGSVQAMSLGPTRWRVQQPNASILDLGAGVAFNVEPQSGWVLWRVP